MNTRQEKILSLLQNGELSIKRAAEQLKVTEMTLRRDLKFLASRKQVKLVKGGAILYPVQYLPTPGTIDYLDEKNAIAEALYKRIMPVKSMFIGTGTTALAFANVLARRNLNPLTVLTCSLSVASMLFQSRCKVILLGGEMRQTAMDLIGPVAEEMIQKYHVEWLVIGCKGAIAKDICSNGATISDGFYTDDMVVCNLEKKSIGIADHVAVITDSSKFGHYSLTRYAMSKEVRLLVTDTGISPSDAAAMVKNGVEVIKASPNKTGKDGNKEPADSKNTKAS